MNVAQTTEIRELTIAELDLVSGGYNPSDYGWTTFDAVLFSSAIGTLVGGLVAWIVDLF